LCCPIAYAAAKAGIEILTQDLAGQIGPYGIRANCIALETILTERNKARIVSGQQKDLIEWHPIRRLGTPEDVAHAALYLGRYPGRRPWGGYGLRPRSMPKYL
jgi:3-oxoacyl-[acyl-carrier protein] reductase